MRFDVQEFSTNSLLKVQLSNGERILAEAGSMMYMREGIKIKENSSDDSTFSSLSHYTASQHVLKTEFYSVSDSAEIVFAPSSPGTILNFNLDNDSIHFDSLSFLCSNSDLDIEKTGSIEALLSGSGLCTEKISGTGNLFLKCFGDVTDLTLAEGEKVSIDTGHLLAFEEGVTYEVLKDENERFDKIADGELQVYEFTGPGKIWMQVRNRSEFAKVIQTFLPRSK